MEGAAVTYDDDDQLEPRWRREGREYPDTPPPPPTKVRIEPTSNGRFRAVLGTGATMHLHAPTKGELIARVREWLPDADIQEAPC